MEILFFLLSFSLAANGVYRSCDQSPFCKRNRKVKAQTWIMLPESFIIGEDFINATIFDKTNEEFLNLSIMNLISDSIRFRIQPFHQDEFRFDLSLESTIINSTELSTKKFISYSNHVVFQNDTHLTISFLKNNPEISRPFTKKIPAESVHQTIELKFSPFSIHIFEDGLPVLIINEKDTAIFETLKTKLKNPQLLKTDNFNKQYPDTFINGPSSVALDFTFWTKKPDETYISGLPFHTLPLKLSSKMENSPIRFSNTDINHYDLNSGMAMYGSVPLLFARGSYSSNKSFSLFWMNPSETFVDILDLKSHHSNGQNIRFMSESGYIDFILNTGYMQKLNDDYTRLTGRPYLTPLFALGYHQSKWGYRSQKELESIDLKLDENIIPHDVLWLDLDHTDDRKYFTWSQSFPNPESLLSKLNENHRYLVTIVDPHIKKSDSYYVYKEAKDKDLLIKDSNNRKAYEGHCWCGTAVWPNFLDEKTRKWWASLYSYKKYKNSAPNLFSWNDMNELSVFNSPDGTVPKILKMKWKKTKKYEIYEEREVHNLHGILMVSATYNGLIERNIGANLRPFILTRSFFSGVQKYSCVWTGDNQPKWSYLKNSIPMMLTHSICGIVYIGADVGGFFDGTTDALLSRWHCVGAWCYTFFRSHCIIESRNRELYLLKGTKYYEPAISDINNRYQLLPYLYTLAHEANQTGIPILRPIWYEFTFDDKNQDKSRIDNEIKKFSENTLLLGDAILVCPFLEEEEKEINVPTLNYKWYEIRTGYPCKGKAEYFGGRTAAYIREGRIVPIRNRIRKSAEKMLLDPVTLIIAVNEDLFSEGWLYIDDGKTFDYQKQKYMLTHFVFSDQHILIDNKTPEFDAEHSSKIYMSKLEIEKIKIYGLNKKVKRMVMDNKSVQFYVQETSIIIKKVNVLKSAEILIEYY